MATVSSPNKNRPSFPVSQHRGESSQTWLHHFSIFRDTHIPYCCFYIPLCPICPTGTHIIDGLFASKQQFACLKIYGKPSDAHDFSSFSLLKKHVFYCFLIIFSFSLQQIPLLCQQIVGFSATPLSSPQGLPGFRLGEPFGKPRSSRRIAAAGRRNLGSPNGTVAAGKHGIVT